MPLINVDLKPRHVAALAARYGYQDTVSDPANPAAQIPNPQSRANFAERQVRDFVKAETLLYEKRQAAIAAEAGVTELETA